MKVCSRCRLLKPYEDFNRARRELDGRKNCCRACQSKEHQAYKVANQERMRQRSREYYATHKAIHRSRCRDWERRNPEKVRGYVKEWKKRNPDQVRDARVRRRVRERGNPVQKVDRSAIVERDGGKCHICRRPVDLSVKHPHPDSLTLDHLIPVAHGGAHSPENLATAHFSCNSRRGAGRTPAQLRLVG